jgi:hypothetical protein
MPLNANIAPISQIIWRTVLLFPIVGNEKACLSVTVLWHNMFFSFHESQSDFEWLKQVDTGGTQNAWRSFKFICTV